MPQQTESAQPIKLGNFDESLDGQKVRIAARILSYDADSGFALVVENHVGVLVDVSLCLNAAWKGGNSWVREKLGTVMIIGYCERTSRTALPKITLAGFHSEVQVKRDAFIRAVLVKETAELNLGLWNEAVGRLSG